jgi:hypothetical protein
MQDYNAASIGAYLSERLDLIETNARDERVPQLTAAIRTAAEGVVFSDWSC